MTPKKVDLGYKRTPAEDMAVRVTFSNGDCFDVSAQVIADDRDKNYADEKEDTIGFIRKRSIDAYALIDWASNNMNWSDLAPYATRLETPIEAFDYEDHWCNAEKEVKGK